MGIVYNRLKTLNAAETEQVKQLSTMLYGKVSRDAFHAKLVVDVHKFEKAGARAKYSIHYRLEHPSTILTAEEADWVLARALHKAAANMQEEGRHKFRKETGRKTTPKPLSTV